MRALNEQNNQEQTELEFAENMTRVDNLMSVYLTLESSNLADLESRRDILRAVVAFMHSSLEELIRNLYIWRLPIGEPEKLDDIPIAIEPPPLKDRKFKLGDLRAFEGMYVENLIRESVVRYTDTFSINNATQLSTCLANVGIKIARINKYFKRLEPMMKRRHQIVHQMDRTNSLDPQESSIQDISHAEVLEWQSCLKDFAYDVIKQIKNQNP